MKTIVNENLKVSAGTRALSECLVNLNSNYQRVMEMIKIAEQLALKNKYD